MIPINSLVTSIHCFFFVPLPLHTKLSLKSCCCWWCLRWLLLFTFFVSVVGCSCHEGLMFLFFMFMFYLCFVFCVCTGIRYSMCLCDTDVYLSSVRFPVGFPKNQILSHYCGKETEVYFPVQKQVNSLIPWSKMGYFWGILRHWGFP